MRGELWGRSSGHGFADKNEGIRRTKPPPAQQIGSPAARQSCAFAVSIVTPGRRRQCREIVDLIIAVRIDRQLSRQSRAVPTCRLEGGSRPKASDVECSQPLKTTMQQENAGHVPRFAPICDRAAVRRALSANHVPGEVLRGDSRQTGNQRNGSAWNLRFELKKRVNTPEALIQLAARRSGPGDHAGPARDAHAHRAATAAEYES